MTAISHSSVRHAKLDQNQTVILKKKTKKTGHSIPIKSTQRKCFIQWKMALQHESLLKKKKNSKKIFV